LREFRNVLRVSKIAGEGMFAYIGAAIASGAAARRPMLDGHSSQPIGLDVDILFTPMPAIRTRLVARHVRIRDKRAESNRIHD
jgi:murein endopeptidase